MYKRINEEKFTIEMKMNIITIVVIAILFALPSCDKKQRAIRNGQPVDRNLLCQVYKTPSTRMEPHGDCVALCAQMPEYRTGYGYSFQVPCDMSSPFKLNPR